jgi:HK97 family phage portal protein
MKIPKLVVKSLRTLAGLPSPEDDWWYRTIGPASLSGQEVTPDSSLKNAAVFGCVRFIAETIASLPLHIYRNLPGGGKERAVNHPLYSLLHDQPNRWQTAFEFIEMMQGHLELRGNAYAEILEGPRGFVDQLIPLHPDRIEIKVLESGRLDYHYKDWRTGITRLIEQERMFHVRGWSSNGIMGVSPIALAAEAVGMSLAAQDYGARFFKNDARPGGLLEHPAELKEEAAKRIAKSWQEAQSGEHRHKIAVLESGMKYHELGLTNKDSQFLESRTFQGNEVARIFRVKPHKIGFLEHATFSNIEHESIDSVVDTFLPRLRRWEQAIKRDLIIAKQTYFAEFLVDGLLRGDIKTRYEAYAIGRQWGWLSVNKILQMENMNPIGPEGDRYLTPMNMQAASELPEKDRKLLAQFVQSGPHGGENGGGE